MKINKKHTHRGALLRQIVSESGLTVTYIVKKTGFSRSSFYNHVNDANLPLDILMQYGAVLKYNFIEEFPELIKNTTHESNNTYKPDAKPETIEEAIWQCNQWKEKYFKLLEKYQSALEQQIRKEK